MRGPWKLSVAAGVRTTTATLVPLVLGQVVGQPAAGLMVGIGGLNVSLSDIGGPYQPKAVTMGAATVSLAIATFVGTVVGELSWVALPLVFLVAGAAGLASMFGNAAAKVSFLSLILFVLMIGEPAGIIEAAERGGALISGGLWAMMLSLGLWPLRPYQPVQEAVAACYRAISAFISVACWVGRGRHDAGSDWEATVMQARATVVNAIEQAHDMAVAVRASRAGVSSTGQELLVMLRTADFIFDAAIALAETLETAADHIDDVQVRAEVENTVQRVAAAVAALETAITQGHDYVELRTLDQALAAVGDKLMAWQQIAMAPAEDDPESLDLHRIAWALETVARHVHAAADILAGHVDRGMAPQQTVIRKHAWQTRLGVVVSMLKDNLTFRSLAFRHALRLGVTAMAAVALQLSLDLPHGAWIAFTAILILKPNFGGTYRQALQRVSGTVAGSVVGAILAAAITRLLFLDLVLIPFGILAFSLMAQNYGLGVLCLTPFIVLILNTVHVGNWEVAAMRGLNTVLGGVLALLAGYLLWPSWERERLPAQLARTIAANRDYFRMVASVYVGPMPGTASMRSTHAQAQLENANAAAAVQRLLSEPRAQRGPFGPIYTLVSANQRFYDGVTTLAVALPASNDRHALPGLETFAKQVDGVLQDLEEAVRNGHPLTGRPTFDESLGETHASIRTMATTGGAQPTAVETDTLQSDAVNDVATLETELDRLADEVVAMSKVLELMYRPDPEP
jgi:uncharacterized membrane protein YccC